MNLYAIMVVYNSKMSDSVAYNCCLKQEGIQLIICDNSTRDFNNKQVVEGDGHIYLNMHGNVGLSKAYNSAIDYINKCDPAMNGYVMILDDDTHIPDAYFQCVKESVISNGSPIYLPVVKDVEGKRGYLSPYVQNGRSFKGVQDIHSIPKEKMCGINSGMVISLSVFKSYRYNENIFLDFVDHNFMYDMHKRGIYPALLDTELLQEISLNNPEKEATKKRFIIYKNDVKAFYCHDFMDRVVCWYELFRRRLQLFMSFKDFNVFKW